MRRMRIVILSGHYADGRYSNSICVRNLAECFSSQGHNVKVIAWGEKDKDFEMKNGVEVCYVKEPQYPLHANRYLLKGGVVGFLFRIYHLIHSILILPFYPNVFPSVARRFYKIAKGVIDKSGTDIVLATYTPYDGIWAGVKLKKKYGQAIKFVSYHLDLISSPDNEGFIGGIKINRGKKAFAKELEIADKILVPEKTEIENLPNVRKVGFPLYVKENIRMKASFNYPSDCVNLTYIGSLSSSNRNPSIAISAVEKLSKETGKKILFHIWGVLGDQKCQEVVEKSSHVVYHGIAKNEEVASLLSQGDMLVNISNSTTYKMIPSKIFQYFAIGKPIVDFVKNENDVSIPFFEKYPKALIIREFNQGMNEIVDALKVFVEDPGKNMTVSVDALYDKYKPETTCKEILN